MEPVVLIRSFRDGLWLAASVTTVTCASDGCCAAGNRRQPEKDLLHATRRDSLVACNGFLVRGNGLPVRPVIGLCLPENLLQNITTINCFCCAIFCTSWPRCRCPLCANTSSTALILYRPSRVSPPLLHCTTAGEGFCRPSVGALPHSIVGIFFSAFPPLRHCPSVFYLHQQPLHVAHFLPCRCFCLLFFFFSCHVPRIRGIANTQKRKDTTN